MVTLISLSQDWTYLHMQVLLPGVNTQTITQGSQGSKATPMLPENPYNKELCEMPAALWNLAPGRPSLYSAHFRFLIQK